MTQRPTLIIGATLIDGTGAPPRGPVSILIEGGRFRELREGDRSTADVDSIDATGKYVIPGLMNANVHLLDGIMLMGQGGVEYLARFEGRYHEVIEEAAQIALKSGMTTVFDTWNALEPVRLARARINSGAVPGARIFFSGNIVGMGGPFTGDFCLECRPTMSRAFADRSDALFEANVGRRLSTLSPEEVRAVIRDYLTTGIDFLKFAVSDHIVIGPSFSHLPVLGPYFTFSDRVQRVIVEETRRAGLPVVTHTTSVESLQAAVDLEVDAMMHPTITAGVAIPDSTIEDMCRTGVWSEIQPTTDGYQAAIEKRGGRWSQTVGGRNRENIGRLVRAGAPIILGTDAGCTDPDILVQTDADLLEERPYTLGQDHFRWFLAMAQFGMKPMDMLLAATRNVAAAYGKLDDLGTVEVGKIADLVILDRNPLDDPRHYASIDRVIKDGATVDRNGLPAKPTVLASRRWCDDPSLLTRYR